MTLIVTLKIPDGLVIAGDSLATITSQYQFDGIVDSVCSKCGNPNQNRLPPIPIPITTSTFPYAQKVFPFLSKYGIGIYGLGLLAGKTIYYILRELENTIDKSEYQNINQVATLISNHIHTLLKSDIDINTLKSPIIGFQIVGYDNDNLGKIMAIDIGNSIITEDITSLGYVLRGQTNVATSILSIPSNTQYGSFSLQDAVDYAIFLINTTASFQRFTNMIPNVGGSIDVALITPFDGYKWIYQKKIGELKGA